MGVVERKDAMQPGYTLFCAGLEVYLIDADGRVVHEWRRERPVFVAYLRPNGNLLCDGSENEVAVAFRAGGAAGWVEEGAPPAPLPAPLPLPPGPLPCPHAPLPPCPRRQPPASPPAVNRLTPPSLHSDVGQRGGLELRPAPLRRLPHPPRPRAPAERQRPPALLATQDQGRGHRRRPAPRADSGRRSLGQSDSGDCAGRQGRCLDRLELVAVGPPDPGLRPRQGQLRRCRGAPGTIRHQLLPARRQGRVPQHRAAEGQARREGRPLQQSVGPLGLLLPWQDRGEGLDPRQLGLLRPRPRPDRRLVRTLATLPRCPDFRVPCLR